MIRAVAVTCGGLWEAWAQGWKLGRAYAEDFIWDADVRSTLSIVRDDP
jgi:hypothetical protein